MFNLGFGELAVIFIVLIIAVGPDRLPAMMKGLGKTIRTVRQASRDIRATVGIDELLREDVMQPLPRRPVPKAAVARPAASASSLPTPAAPPTENARPPDAPVPEAIPAAGAAPAAASVPAPADPAAAAPCPADSAAQAPASEAAPNASAGESAPRKD